MWTGGKPGGNRIASAGGTIAGGVGGAGGVGVTTDGGVCELAPEPGVVGRVGVGRVGGLGVGMLGVGKLQIRCRYEPHGCEGPGPTQPEMFQLMFALVVTEPDTVELEPECEFQNVCGGGLECEPEVALGTELGPELIDGA